MTGDLAERPPRSFAFGPFVLIPERQLLLKDEAPVRIGGRALDILTALVERAGDLVSKRELCSRALAEHYCRRGQSQGQHGGLAAALGEGPGNAQYIATVTGRGYRFVAPVQTSCVRPSRHWPPRRPHQAATTCPLGQRASSEGRMRSTPFGAIWMRRGSCRLSAPAASGKTTVAIAAAHAAARERADGGTFIDLATISESQFLAPAIASALGLGMTGGDPLASVVHALKFQQKVLCSTIASICCLRWLLPWIGSPANLMTCGFSRRAASP